MVGFVISLLPGPIALMSVGWLGRVEFLVSVGLAAQLVSILVGCLGGARPCLRRKPRFTYSVSQMVSCLLRTVVRTRVVLRAGEVTRAEAAAGLDLMAVDCAAPTVTMTVG